MTAESVGRLGGEKSLDAHPNVNSVLRMWMNLDFLSPNQTRWLNGWLVGGFFPLFLGKKNNVAFCRLQKAFHEYTHQHCNCSTGRLLVSTVLSPGGFIPLCWDQGLQALVHPPSRAEELRFWLWTIPRPPPSPRLPKQMTCSAGSAVRMPGCVAPWSRQVGRSSPAWWLHHCCWFRRANFPTFCLKKSERKIVFLNAEWKRVLKIAVEQNDCLPCSSVCHCCTKPNEKLESRISSAPGACTAGNTVCFRLLHHALLSGWTGQKIRVTHRHAGTFWCEFCWLWSFKQFF